MLYPAYYPAFSCLADNCPDSCCQGWEIDIDPRSLARYEGYEGPLKEKLSSAILRDGENAHFRTDEEGRCPFLNARGLCDIYTEMGKDALCEICTEHPRFYNKIGKNLYAGLGMSCEAAARLILTSDCTSLPSEGEEEEETLSGDEETVAWFWKDNLHKIHSQSESFLIGRLFGRREALLGLLDFLLTLEINRPAWGERIGRLKERLDTLLAQKKAFLEACPDVRRQFERIFSYLVYRHGPKALEFEDCEVGMEAEQGFCYACASILLLLDLLIWVEKGSFTVKDQIELCRLFSEEIEYSEENTRALEDYSFTFMQI